MNKVKNLATQTIYDFGVNTVNNLINLQLNHVDSNTTTEQKLKNVDALQRVRDLLDTFYENGTDKKDIY
ncbi:hypothetical protein IOU64_004439 [Salmonella enterica]|nr:hypothetical protein [Salmonella enterica]